MAKAKDLHTDLGLKEEDLIEMYRYMLLARCCDERQWALNRQGKAPFVVPVSGHEAAQVGSAWAFEKGKDVFCPYYRDMALCSVAGFTPKDVFLGLFGKKDDPSSGRPSDAGALGRARPQHHHRLVADRDAGAARGRDRLLEEAEEGGRRRRHLVRRGRNLRGRLARRDELRRDPQAAARLRLREQPVRDQRARVEAGRRAASTSGRRVTASPGFDGDGNDVLESYRLTKEAVDRARAGEGPSLIELRTYRYYSHTSDDDDRTYRSRKRSRSGSAKDPIPRFENYLKSVDIIDDKKIEEMREQTKTEVAEGAKEAEEADFPDLPPPREHVYGDMEVV